MLDCGVAFKGLALAKRKIVAQQSGIAPVKRKITTWQSGDPIGQKKNWPKKLRQGNRGIVRAEK